MKIKKYLITILLISIITYLLSAYLGIAITNEKLGNKYEAIDAYKSFLKDASPKAYASIIKEVQEKLNLLDNTKAATGQRIELPGFSFIPPHGEGWKLIRKKSNIVGFAKPFDRSPLNTFAAIAEVLPVSKSIDSLEEFLFYVKVNHTHDTKSPDRFEFTDYKGKQAPELGSYCVRYEVSAKDLKVRDQEGHPMLIRNIGYACLHPDSKKHLIDIWYSTRTSISLILDQRLTEGERFIDSIKFIPL